MENTVKITVQDKYDISLVLGKTKKEWKETFDSDNLWDFPIEEIFDGTVEPNTENYYWYIKGRLYETDVPCPTEEDVCAEIIVEIKSLLKGCHADFTECSYSICVQEGRYDDDTYTLDDVYERNGELCYDASSCENNMSGSLKELSSDILRDIASLIEEESDIIITEIPVVISDIKWEPDEENGLADDLPNEIEVNIPKDELPDTEDEDIEEYISEWLSDEYGFFHNGFSWERK